MATASIAIGLSIGIALGLNRRGKDNANTTANPPPISGTPAQPSVKLHGLMSNTPLTAITTTPDNARHLYFQEKTGSFRRAVYSSQATPWRTATDDAHLPPDAKNNTLLAGVTGFLTDSPDLDILIYVNSTNQLSCVDWWGLRDSSRCTIKLPKTSVAAGSRQISATTLGYDKDLRGLLLTYTDATSEKAVMMLGFVNTSYPQTTKLYTWRNETDRLSSALDYYPSAFATTCIAGVNLQNSTLPYFLGCYVNSTVKGGPTVIQFDFSLSTSGDLTIRGESSFNHDMSFVADSDVAPLAQGGALFLSHSTSQYGFDPIAYGGTTQSPTSRFPFNRLTSTYATNSNSTYLYHQLNDTVLAEELWDGTSGFWISSNITIDTL
ncbi:MAG: hypothetical protein Q9203_004915 [Teloschistes exilis]